MKLLTTLFALALTTLSFGQTLPRESTATTINQTLGINDLTLSYSRPNVKGRVIFGDLVPYSEIWRLGANECTRFTCSLPVEINGQVLEAGSYAVFAIPRKYQWEIIFNSDDEQWGAYDHDPSKDVLKYTTAAIQGGHTETLSIGFESITSSSTNIVIRWADMTVSVPCSTDTDGAVEEEIKTALSEGEDLARVHYNAADYFLDAGDSEKAQSYLENSLKIERAYYNVYMKAKMVSEKAPSEARKLADEAIDLAKKADKEDWAGYIEKKSADWK